MPESLEHITSEALLLPDDERLTLAQRILASVEPPSEAGAEAAWDMAIRERIKSYDAGNSASIPVAEVFTELDKKLKK